MTGKHAIGSALFSVPLDFLFLGKLWNIASIPIFFRMLNSPHYQALNPLSHSFHKSSNHSHYIPYTIYIYSLYIYIPIQKQKNTFQQKSSNPHLKGSRQATLGARHWPLTKHTHPNSHYGSHGTIMVHFHRRHIVATAESWHLVVGLLQI